MVNDENLRPKGEALGGVSMLRLFRMSLAAAAIGAAVFAVGAPALADGPPETPPTRPAAPPAQPTTPRAAPLQPTTPPAQPPATPTAADGPVTGDVTLANGSVQLTVPAGFEFWPAPEAQAFLQRTNSAPPAGEVLGLLAPAGTRPTHADFWGAVLSYQPIGHVSADSAAGLQAETLEADVRSARQGAQRPFEGFALRPAFDPAGSLTWAERTAAPAANVRDLRHEVRKLGRGGVISLTSIARTDQQAQVVSASAALLAACAFPAGQGYADFNAATDPGSQYDLPGLVAGTPTATMASAPGGPQGVISKTSGDAKGGAGLQGWFPWIALGVVALAAIGWFAMGRRNRDLDDDDEEEEETVAAEPKPDPPPAATTT